MMLQTGCPHCGRSLKKSGLVLNDGHRTVSFNDSKDILLTPKEFSILSLLLTNSGRYVSAAQVTNHLWFEDPNGGPENPLNNIHVHITRLRKKLRSIGYVFASDRRGFGSRGWRVE